MVFDASRVRCNKTKRVGFRGKKSTFMTLGLTTPWNDIQDDNHSYLRPWTSDEL